MAGFIFAIFLWEKIKNGKFQGKRGFNVDIMREVNEKMQDVGDISLLFFVKLDDFIFFNEPVTVGIDHLS